MKRRFQRYIVRTEILSIKSSLVTMGRPKFTLKTAPSLRRSPPHLIHSSLDRPHSPPQTASGSNQLFATIHFADRDRPTDRQMVQANVPYHKRSARYSERERRANNILLD